MKLLHALVSLAAVSLAAVAQGQGYPDKPIKMIVPSGAGGANDVTARTVSAALAKELGQPVVVDNRPGAGGNIGLELAAKSAPDGYTLVFTDGQMTSSPSLYNGLRFDPGKDFQPISLVTRMEYLLVVRSDSDFKSVGDVVRFAKDNPGTLNYSTGGNGTVNHSASEMFKMSAGQLDIRHVPFKTMGESMTALVGGQAQLAFVTPSSSSSLIKAGRLKVIATTGSKRSAQYPDAPTIRELFNPGFELYGWGGILMPAGVSAAIAGRMQQAVQRAAADPLVRSKLQEAGFEVIASTAEAFHAQVTKELAEWPSIVKLSAVKMN